MKYFFGVLFLIQVVAWGENGVACKILDTEEQTMVVDRMLNNYNIHNGFANFKSDFERLALVVPSELKTQFLSLMFITLLETNMFINTWTLQESIDCYNFLKQYDFKNDYNGEALNDFIHTIVETFNTYKDDLVKRKSCTKIF